MVRMIYYSISFVKWGRRKKTTWDPETLARHALEALKRPLTLKEALSSVADFRIDRRKKPPLRDLDDRGVRDDRRGEGPYVRRRFAPKCLSGQQPAIQRPMGGRHTPFTGRWLLADGCWNTSAAGRLEDRSRARREDLAENLAMLRHVVINVLRLDKSVFGGISVKRKELTWDDEKLLGLMLAA